DGDREATGAFVSSIFTVLSFLITLIVAAGIALAPLFVPLFGTDPAETTLLTRVMFPYLACISLAALFQGILNSTGSFAPSGFTPILFNLAVIGTTALFSNLMANPARAMATGVVLGGALQCLFQLPFVLKKGVRLSLTGLRAAFRNPGTRTVLRLIAPTIVGMAAYQLNEIVSVALAGNAGPGVASSLQFSLRLQELVLGVFAVSVGTVMLPQLSAHVKSERWADFNRELAGSLNVIALITVPITFFALVTGEAIVTVLFRGRSFGAESTALTVYAFRFHMLGVYFIALNRILAPAFYAQKNTLAPTAAGIASFGLNIALAVILSRPMQGGGIALALSIAGAVNTVMLLALLRRNAAVDIGMIARSMIPYLLKILLLSVVAVAPVYFLQPRFAEWLARAAGLPLRLNAALVLIASALVFFALWLAGLLLTRDRQLKALIESLHRKLGR
ncbi:MAG: murein biosynthesis integral membrane protein MurJ, partial [Spirochaetales bacterium]|nr:murein biosynthesis integral membrane protein MurJ [Spirochaetales bacterium]